MNDAQRADVRRRARNLLFLGPIGIVTVGVVSTPIRCVAPQL
jgi:hypothetical protein